MATIIAERPGTDTTFEAALRDMEVAIGAGSVLRTAPELADFGDPFAPPGDGWYKPGAVLTPGSVAEIQAILRVANEHGTPVWTNGQGRNSGYGGAAPRVSGSFTLSLRRMNKVLEVDEDSAWALLEPGVSFFDLHDHLKAIGSKLWMSVPDLGWGSVVGNALEHGVGYTPLGDHFDAKCGMEVVLANGEILRTGLGGLENPRAWHVYKHGCGPTLDGLFTQSNYGIVTKIGTWLMPAPDCYMPGWLTLAKDSDLEPMLERLRPLMMNGTIPNQPMIINAVCAASAFWQRDHWYTGDGPIPEEVIDKIAATPGFGRWVMRFALYGDERIVERQREIVQDVLGTIPGATITFDKFDGHDLPDLDNPHHRVQAGIPSLALDQMTRWYGGEKGGHIGFSSATPITARDGGAIRDLVRDGLHEAGLDYSAAIIVTKRALIHVGLVVFDTENAVQANAAYGACKTMVVEAAKRGYGEYRSHLDFMDLVADQYSFGNHAQRRFAETIKDCVDPNGILSPGKQGIWPRAYRQ